MYVRFGSLEYNPALFHYLGPGISPCELLRTSDIPSLCHYPRDVVAVSLPGIRDIVAVALHILVISLLCHYLKTGILLLVLCHYLGRGVLSLCHCMVSVLCHYLGPETWSLCYYLGLHSDTMALTWGRGSHHGVGCRRCVTGGGQWSRMLCQGTEIFIFWKANNILSKSDIFAMFQHRGTSLCYFSWLSANFEKKNCSALKFYHGSQWENPKMCHIFKTAERRAKRMKI